jgi:predicted NBD/HSP70 family sugar kinase
MIYLGFDFGGTKGRGHEVIPVYEDNRLADAKLGKSVFKIPEIPTKKYSSSDELNQEVFQNVQRFGTPKDVVVSGSIAGLTNQKTLEATCANIHFPLTFLGFLRREGYQSFIFNDLFAAGTALARIGSGGKYSRVSILNAGSGNNIACAFDGKVYTTGTEAGHTFYVDGGLFCGCDGQSHLESYASGNGAATMAVTYFFNHPQDRRHMILEETLKDYNLENDKEYSLDRLKDDNLFREIVFSIQGKHVMNAYKRDPESSPQEDIRRLVRNALAKQLGDITGLYRPELIIIRGSFVTENWEELGRPSVERFLNNYRRFTHPAIPKPIIEKKKLKRDGTIGAVLCAIDELEKH